MPFRPKYTQSFSENQHTEEVRSVGWLPFFGMFLGIVFVITGVLIWSKLLGANWWIEAKIRIVLAITVILYGIYRITVYLPKFYTKKRKSLREQMDELEEK